MPKPLKLRPHQQELLEALVAIGMPDAEPWLRKLAAKARYQQRRLMSPLYGAHYIFTRNTSKGAQGIANWLTAAGFPPLTIPPAPSNGLRHSLYVDPRRSVVVLHINGRDYDVL